MTYLTSFVWIIDGLPDVFEGELLGPALRLICPQFLRPHRQQSLIRFADEGCAFRPAARITTHAIRQGWFQAFETAGRVLTLLSELVAVVFLFRWLIFPCAPVVCQWPLSA